MEARGQKPGRAGESNAVPRKLSFEPLALVLLSLATVGTAWCSFQAATWGGISQRTMNLSAALSREAAAAQLQFYQIGAIDVLVFSQFVNARAVSNESLAKFYSDRFRGEAKAAVDAWLATRPLENTNAPAHPFVPELYQPRILQQAKEAESGAQRLWREAGEAGRTSRSYVLITVLLASALFCGGVVTRFDTFWIRLTVVGLGLAVFAFASGRLLLLPVQL